MIYIQQNATNTIFVNVSEYKTLSNPNYLWRLQNSQGRNIVAFYPENITSTYPNSYANKYDVFTFNTYKTQPENFIFTGGSPCNIWLENENQYWLGIYEKPNTSSFQPSAEKLLNSLAFVFVEENNEFYTGNTANFEPNKIYYKDGNGITPTPSNTPSQTPNSSPNPTSTSTPTPTPTPTSTSTPTPTQTQTGTPVPTTTPTQTGTPVPTTTPTPTQTQTGTPNPTPTPTQTGTPNPTATPTPTPTQTGTPNPTATPTQTPTQTQSGTPNPTSTPTPTQTQTQTGTPNPTPTPTQTQTQTGTPNPTGTPTPTPTQQPGAAQAQAYLSAVVSAGGTGITPTISAATITLFTSIYSNGLQNGMIYMYPFLGGNAAGHKFNALDPQDTNGAYRLTFNGGWTHSASGATPNGTNAYANTWMAPSSITALTISGGTAGMYSGTDAAGGAAFGSGNGNNYWALYPKSAGSTMGALAWESNTGAATTNTIPNSLGGLNFTRSGTTTSVQFYRRGGLVQSVLNTANAKSSEPLYLGALNQNGTDNQYSTYRHQFTYAHTGLTSSQITTLDGIIQTYQTSLGRNTY